MKRGTYRTRRNQLVVLPVGLIAPLLGLILAASPSASLPIRLVGLVGLVGGVAYVWRGVRIGVDIDDDGVIVRGPFTSERLSKDDIAAVGTHTWFANVVVNFDLKDGRRLGTNLIQGARTTSPDGTTKDVMSVLQRELAAPSPEPLLQRPS